MAARTRRKGWHPEDIKAELRKQFGNLTDLAVQWGYHRAAVSMAIVNPRNRPGVARRITEALQQQPHTLWPDHFPPAGEERSRAVNDPQPSRRADGMHRQKRSAA